MMDKQITQHFKNSEFMCHCGCNKIVVNMDLFNALESLRAMITDKNESEMMIIITSGYRCRFYNKKISTSSSGYHPRGMAADIFAVSKKGGIYLPMLDLYRIAESSRLFNGLGAYPHKGHIHVDIRYHDHYNRWIVDSSGVAHSLTRG